MTACRGAAIAAALAVAVATAGCHRPEAVPDASAVTIAAGAVTIAQGSPMLKQIGREQVRDAELATDEVIAPGKIEANPNRVTKVVAPVAGRVGRVLVAVGDAVRQGQPLFTIESPDADAAMSSHLQADAAVTQARAALLKAQADVDRTGDLFDHNAVAKKEVLNAESALAQARAALDQALASREQADRRLSVLGLTQRDFKEPVTVRSPIAGKVLDLSLVSGEFRNDTSAPVMTIADLSTVWVSAQVPETSIRFIHPREKVEIRLVAYPDEVFDGRVRQVADTVDPQTRTVKVHAELDNRQGRFRPEMFGSIHHIESTARMAVIPAAAVIEGDGHATVFVESPPGTFQPRAVVLGKPAGAQIRVISGLRPGETVVVDGAILLSGLLKKPA
ncbi:MAG: efflux transporter, family, subunit [Acidobacteria bacterium]|nr:efflux transporter, family, subunit [Acidobacteriota bacterium]